MPNVAATRDAIGNRVGFSRLQKAGFVVDFA